MRSLLLSRVIFVTSVCAQTPPEELTVAPGFKVELLKAATKAEGSWVCMAIDGRGQLYISPQGKPEGAGFKKDDAWGGLFRATLDAQGQIAQWKKVSLPVGDAMGMLWAFDSLYVSGDGPEGRAIYRLKDSNADDTLDTWTLFKKVPGGNGEHGAHALVLGPDGKSIYIVHGNSTPLIDGIDGIHSPYRSYAEDDLLSRVMDPVATFFDKIKSPYGHVLRTDENGTKWEIFAAGFRNPYDIAFNADGELFTYDSDMEWDVGLPWYRPTRVLHVVPGGEYGFREGSAKWPAWYPDSLPPVVNIGLGCPTGVRFGTQAKFPEKYRKAFFIMDWTFGRILAVHLHPRGASYTAENKLPSPYHLTSAEKSEDVEEFVKGKGLPVTDLEFGKDGAMYFTIGGRGTQGGLYRVSWKPSAEQESQISLAEGTTSGKAPAIEDRESVARKTRREIEWLGEGELGPADADRDALHAANMALQSEDRFLSFAARQVVEEMKPEGIKELLTMEKDTRRALTLALALARVGTKDDQAAILKALGRFPLDSLSDELKLEKLRVIEVALARHGRPATELVQMGVEKLSAQYPAKTFDLNRELCALLVWLTRESSTADKVAGESVIEKTLGLIDGTGESAEQIWYALCLREASGWTPVQRERYFAWFAKAANYRGGNSLKKFVLRIRDQALEKVPEQERAALLALAEKVVAPPAPKPVVPSRDFVKAWTLDELVPALPAIGAGRNLARGKTLYTAAMCAQCHQFAGEGGATGPDLTAVASRYSRKDLLEAILDPSKALSEQYASFIFTMKDGSMVGGQIAEENHYLLTLIVDPLTGAKQNFPKGNVVKREMSPVSLMPPGLLFTLSQDEILDLLAYLETGGK